ncbi:16S rRNA (cytidine(1402)-2'-O)-methyltransferase [Candidatus Pandoraea novymonadis]|uniref:Ribosomal RNA small subunit methyltransferase I n=1 Tax=Candidatus Pandoraea novymonadis TaxID=1808959 RepID=A0ABX5FFE9_9BURK|nr:16S rRNA (cytidine(1402)-2'-O)-methyltransferase [Candidatus Pandoraea novymonadis]PSB92451.1 Ribosomal RNA small subunit methyltransferase I [Candidatus Pandoraea novymonadis]
MDDCLLSLAYNQSYPAGTLYVVATPLGNVADITLRALHVLMMVDVIAAEDTRNSSQLLSRYGIDKPLIATHEHNESVVAKELVSRLRTGERIAYISDAGTPGISDPGAQLVDAVRSAGLQIMPIPGVSALVTLLSAAGSWIERFIFFGFLPSKSTRLESMLKTLKNETSTLIFYEAPHRIVETISTMTKVLGGDRRLLIGRELTKRFEQIHECNLHDAVTWFGKDTNRQRGEFVLAVEGALEETASAGINSETERVLTLLLRELSIKNAVQLTSAITGTARNKLYNRALMLKKMNQ